VGARISSGGLRRAAGDVDQRRARVRSADVSPTFHWHFDTVTPDSDPKSLLLVFAKFA